MILGQSDSETPPSKDESLKLFECIKMRNYALVTKLLPKSADRYYMMKLILVGLLGLALTACSASSSVEDLTVREKITHPGVARGLVSAAQSEFTVDGYRVSTSAGYFANGTYKKVKGYSVYTSLSGALAADTYEEQIK